MNLKRWTQKTFVLEMQNNNLHAHSLALDEKLAELNDQGWEVTQITRITYKDEFPDYVLLAKRPL